MGRESGTVLYDNSFVYGLRALPGVGTVAAFLAVAVLAFDWAMKLVPSVLEVLVHPVYMFLVLATPAFVAGYGLRTVRETALGYEDPPSLGSGSPESFAVTVGEMMGAGVHAAVSLGPYLLGSMGLALYLARGPGLTTTTAFVSAVLALPLVLLPAGVGQLARNAPEDVALKSIFSWRARKSVRDSAYTPYYPREMARIVLRLRYLPAVVALLGFAGVLLGAAYVSWVWAPDGWGPVPAVVNLVLLYVVAYACTTTGSAIGRSMRDVTGSEYDHRS